MEHPSATRWLGHLPPLRWLLCCAILTRGGATTTSAPFHDSNFDVGRDVIVHLFEWKWTDVADECERYLGPMGFAGVQVSPPQENAVVFRPPFNPTLERPWFERYQPVSYKLITRSGNEEQFADMVRRCNDQGVRIYVDAVINHMTGDFPAGTKGTGGSDFDSQTLSYNTVPYGPTDFHSQDTCPSGSGNIEDYGNRQQVRNCKLVNLKDLDQAVDNVRNRIVEYLNRLLALGVAGFRIDAAKHMNPDDLKVIYSRLDNCTVEIFGENRQPLIYQEVIDLGGEAISCQEYSDLARVTEFRYGMKLGTFFRGGDQLRWLKSIGEAWQFAKSEDALVFIDNHDNQRGHGAGGLGTILTFRDSRLYQMATAFLLAWPYGLKQIMSSFQWQTNYANDKDLNDWIGPPHDANFNTLPVIIKDDGQCGNGWVCEHRWPVIAQMVKFSWVAGQAPMVNWWDNQNNQIAFSRGSLAFFAVNNEASQMEVQIQSSLPPGRYCDVTTGAYVDGACTGRMVTVNRMGRIYVNLPGGGDSLLALHAEAMVEDFGTTYMQQTATYDTPESDYRRTVVLIQKETTLGEYVFIRGGVGPENRQICYSKPQSCTIPITFTNRSANSDYYQEWQINDVTLDWGGAEENQGKFKNKEASGSPLFWSSNDPEDANYYEFNTFGSNYWVFDVLMDCSKTHYGWFEFKVCQPNDVWERSVNQNGGCKGETYSAQKPFASGNHQAMCGKINSFHYGANDCYISDFREK